MEFRHPYMVAMQDQNPKLYRRLRDSGDLDRLVNLKAQEASRLYKAIMEHKPPTMQNEREAEEQVRSLMFEFPDDLSQKLDEKAALLNEKIVR